MLRDGDTVLRSIRYQCGKNCVRKKEVKTESLKAWRCVRRILQVTNVTRAQATVGAEEMEKNL